MCKLLEKIVSKRLLWTLEKKKLLAPEQSGFRNNRSTLDNLIDLESVGHEAFSNDQKCIAIFFVINRACDLHQKIKKMEYLKDP